MKICKSIISIIAMLVIGTSFSTNVSAAEKMYTTEEVNQIIKEKDDEINEWKNKYYEYQNKWYSWDRLDLNDDGTVDAIDASILLTVYAKASVDTDFMNSYHNIDNYLYINK